MSIDLTQVAERLHELRTQLPLARSANRRDVLDGIVAFLEGLEDRLGEGEAESVRADAHLLVGFVRDARADVDAARSKNEVRGEGSTLRAAAMRALADLERLFRRDPAENIEDLEVVDLPKERCV